MNELTTKIEAGLPTQFEPQKTMVRNAALDAACAHAKRIKDWNALAEAAWQQIAEQREFVAWWGEHVGVHHGAGRGNKKIADLQSFSVEKATDLTGIAVYQVSRWRKRLANEEVYHALLCAPSHRKALGETHDHRAQAQEPSMHDIEWYTPPDILAVARGVLGAFDLDPASSETAQRNVMASRHFTKTDNGLEQEWRGRVWLNPPYSQPLIAQFAAKMIAERRAARVSEAIMLTNSSTDTAWFNETATECDALCFSRGRIKFHDANGKPANSPLVGQAFFYFGDDVAKFAVAFSKIGFVVTPYWGEVA